MGKNQSAKNQTAFERSIRGRSKTDMRGDECPSPGASYCQKKRRQSMAPRFTRRIELFFNLPGQPGFSPGGLVFMNDSFAGCLIQHRGDFLEQIGFFIRGFFGVEFLYGAPDEGFDSAVSLSRFFRCLNSFFSGFVCWQLVLLNLKFKSTLKYKKLNRVVN
jgi:hypothetical protein